MYERLCVLRLKCEELSVIRLLCEKSFMLRRMYERLCTSRLMYEGLSMLICQSPYCNPGQTSYAVYPFWCQHIFPDIVYQSIPQTLRTRATQLLRFARCVCTCPSWSVYVWYVPGWPGLSYWTGAVWVKCAGQKSSSPSGPIQRDQSLFICLRLVTVTALGV